MRIGNKAIEKRPEEILVLPRGNDNIVFKALPVDSYDEFDKMVALPKPPKVVTPSGTIEDKQNLGYKQQLENYAKTKFAWMCIQSLVPSEIEWDTVIADNPGTWPGWSSDLQSAGFNPAEMNLIVDIVMAANTLSEKRLAQARESFLLGNQTPDQL